MIIGVMSDTHGDNYLMREAANLMVVVHRVDIIYHLGDDYRDSQALARAGVQIEFGDGGQALGPDGEHVGAMRGQNAPADGACQNARQIEIETNG